MGGIRQSLYPDQVVQPQLPGGIPINGTPGQPGGEAGGVGQGGGLQQIMQHMIDSGATQLPPVNAGPAGTTNYALSQGLPPEDEGDDLYYNKPIDTEQIQGLTKDKLVELADTIWTLANQGLMDRKNGGRDDNMEMFRDLYEEVADNRQGPWRDSCNLTTPDTRIQVETTAARITHAIFSSPEWMKIKPGVPEEQEACKRSSDFGRSEMGGANISLKARFYEAAQDALVDGYVVGCTSWIRKKDKVRERVILNDQVITQLGGVPPAMMTQPGDPVKIGKKVYKYGQWVLIETEKVVQNHFNLDFVAARDTVMWPADAPNEQVATLYGYFIGQTPDEMRNLAYAGYYDKEAVEDVIATSQPMMAGDTIMQSQTPEQQNRDFVMRSSEQGENRFGRRQIFYGHARVYDADGDNRYEDICVSMEWTTKKFMRVSLPDAMNGRRPFRRCYFYPRVGRGYYPYSQVEKTYNTQQELNAVTRQGIDAATLAMSAIIEEGPGRRKLSKTEFGPGVSFRDTSVDGEIKAIHEFPNVPNANLADREAIRRMIEKLGGQDPSAQGIADNGADTLGQTNIAVQGGNIRLNMAIEFGLEFLTWLYQQFFDYSFQYMEERQSYEIKRDGKSTYAMISLDDIAAVQEATVQAYTANLDPQAGLKAQKAQIIFQMLANSPFLQGNYLRQWRLLVWFARVLDNDDDMTQFIGTEDEANQMNEAYSQQMAQSTAMMMQGGQGQQIGGPPQQGPQPGPGAPGVPGVPQGSPPPR
jgi:hypothetical protein